MEVNNTSQLMERNRVTRLQVMILIFFVGCIIGWIYEEIFYYFTEQWIGNRGFLYGPYLPVYGFGAVLMALFLHHYKKNPIMVFLLGMLITGILEYITGLGMWLIWHHRWWDYTNEFLNIQGFICLRSLLSFAIGGLALIYVIEPLEESVVAHAKYRVIPTVCILGIAIMVIDLCVTLLTRY